MDDRQRGQYLRVLCSAKPDGSRAVRPCQRIYRSAWQQLPAALIMNTSILGLSNNVTYYYRLEMISSSLGSTFSNVISTTIGQPTPTVTQTLTPTRTVTQTGTITPTGPTPTPTGSLTATTDPNHHPHPFANPHPHTYPLRYFLCLPLSHAGAVLVRLSQPEPITPTWTLFPGAKTSTAQVNSTLLPQQSPTVFSTSTLDIIGLPTDSPTLEGTLSSGRHSHRK